MKHEKIILWALTWSVLIACMAAIAVSIYYMTRFCKG
jgi:hypothetical protein